MNCYRCATPLPDDARFCLACGADVSGETGERTLPVEIDAELLAKLQDEVSGEYTIERELGRGGMAAVFLATDIHLGRKVALKVLPPELTFGSGMVERFKREARTAATLDHPHIIPIYRVSTGGKLFWYAMKYLEGETLADIMEREAPLPVERAADILKQVAQGLEYAHKHGVIHRDVKPANIAVDEAGWVTVTDFGIAKALATKSLTGSGSMIGTPYYMSPEQCAGRKVTGGSDQYSLGVLAYQMLSGHLPFTGESIVDIIKKHCMDPPPPLAVLRSGLPPDVVAVVERALAKSPEDRFPSVTAFAAAFASAAEPKVVEVAPPVAPPARPRRTSVTADLRPAPEAVRPVRQPSRRSGTRRALSIAGKTAVLVGVATLVFWPDLRKAWRSAPSAGIEQASREAPTPPPVARTPTAPTTAARQPRAGPAPTASPAAAAPRQQPPAGTTAVSSPVASARPSRLVLRGLLPGATLLLDGRRVRGSRVPLQAGRRHVVTVMLSGYETWADTVRLREGQDLVRTVEMRPVGQRGAAPVGAVSAAVPQAPTPEPAAAPPQPPPAAGVAYVTVGSRPLAAMSINGRPAPSNPVVNYEVPAGVVRLDFAVTDSSGTWFYHTSVTVAAGEHKNLGYLRLERRQ